MPEEMNSTRRRDPAGGPLTGTRPPAAPPGNFAGLFGVERARAVAPLGIGRQGDHRHSPAGPGDHRRAQVVVTQEAAEQAGECSR